MKRVRAIVLYSGGLDSLLAAKILMEQGVEVTGFHCILPFTAPDFPPEELDVSRMARQIDLPLVHYRCDDAYIAMIKNPPHGYGKHMNPCVDCKIFFLQRGTEYMNKTGADFIATGEVVGQRPMSQLKHTMNHIIKETGLHDRLLRPLSAKILKPTPMEEEGLVDREKLFDISGRGRRRQLELAEEYGITEFSSPAGGCLFTDRNIARRVRDMFVHHETTSPLDLYLMTTGRHFRISEKTKVIISRNEGETRELEKYRDRADLFMEPAFKGPAAFLRGEATEETRDITAALISRYGSPIKEENKLYFTQGEINGSLEAPPAMSEDDLHYMRI